MTLVQSFLGEQSLLLWLVLGLVGFVLTWQGANVVESTTSEMSDHFGVSQAIQGGIIAAVATSFPELAITVISVLVLGEFGTGAGALIGTAVFNILVIPGAVAVRTGDTPTTRGIVYRDAIFYLVAILGFFAVIALGVIGTDGREVAEITPQMGIGLMLVYVAYLILIIGGQKRSGSGNGEGRQSTNLPKQFGLFVGGLFVVLVGVEFMIGMTLEISTALDAPPFLMSVTVLSILSSFPDLLVGVEMGEGGDQRAAIANVFGTNTFNLVMVLPIGAILASGVSIGFLAAVPLLLFLFYTTLVVVVLAATDFEISQLEGYFLLGLYVVFLLWMVSEALGLSTLLTEQTLRTILS
ncbi:MAG: Ca2+/Na+ antiporter [halophilic archaeon J07HX64]|jgi:Ca2+/Na+ antiporter|nr:MAG: Ca2+/Na+ antiporter [halophilic archaeon J07HX64]